MRARNIKPGFFSNEDLGTADPMVPLTFSGLWCLADKDGILEDRPKRIKAELFPYRDGIDVNGYLTVLERLKFIRRYEIDGKAYIIILEFLTHQTPHHTERPKGYPQPPALQEECSLAPLTNRELPVRTRSDSLIPDSLIHTTVNSASSVPSTPDPAPNPTGPALISKAFREHGVQSNPSDPRIIALADRGLGYDQALAAAEEARRSKPGESISPGYVVKILERWADEADKSRNGQKLNGTPRPQTIHEQRAAVIAGLCTPSAAALPPPQEDFLDVESHRIA